MWKLASIFSEPPPRSTFAGSGMMFNGVFDCAFSMQAPVAVRISAGRMLRVPGPTRFIGDPPNRFKSVQRDEIHGTRRSKGVTTLARRQFPVRNFPPPATVRPRKETVFLRLSDEDSRRISSSNLYTSFKLRSFATRGGG